MPLNTSSSGKQFHHWRAKQYLSYRCFQANYHTEVVKRNIALECKAIKTFSSLILAFNNRKIQTLIIPVLVINIYSSNISIDTFKIRSFSSKAEGSILEAYCCMNLSTILSNASIGTAPESSKTSWNSRRLNFSPNFCSARARSSRILSSPSL